MLAVQLACIPLVYLIVMLSLSGVRKLGLKNLSGNVHFRRKKVQRKEDDLMNLVSNTYHAIRMICKTRATQTVNTNQMAELKQYFKSSQSNVLVSDSANQMSGTKQ